MSELLAPLPGSVETPRVNPRTGVEMAPLASVFGGEKATPHEVFEQGRIISAETRTSAPRPNDMSLACPRCDAVSQESRLFSSVNGSANVFYCIRDPQNHVWKDYDQLMLLNPRKIPFKGQAARQDGWKKMTLEIPGSTMDALQTKFGDRLGATLLAVFENLIESRLMMVGEADLKRLSQTLGQDVRTPAELCGMVYSLYQDKQRAEESGGSASASPASLTATSVVVDFGPRLFNKVQQLCQEKNWAVDEMLKYAFEQSLEANWL